MEECKLLRKQEQFLQYLQLLSMIGELDDEPFPDDPNIYIDHNELLANALLFAGSFRIAISQSFYNSTFLECPFKFVCTLIYVGKSSFTETREMTRGNDLECFARMSQQMIRIDAKTRKPLELPEHWREKFGNVRTGTPYVMAKLTRPHVHTVSIHYTIQTTDLDIQNHTNWVAYINLCLKVCKTGMDQKMFTKSLLQNNDNGIKEFQIRYENEALLNDDVIIYAWQITESDELGFEICKGADVCVQATMTFYCSSLKESKVKTIASKI